MLLCSWEFWSHLTQEVGKWAVSTPPRETSSSTDQSTLPGACNHSTPEITPCGVAGSGGFHLMRPKNLECFLIYMRHLCMRGGTHTFFTTFLVNVLFLSVIILPPFLSFLLPIRKFQCLDNLPMLSVIMSGFCVTYKSLFSYCTVIKKVFYLFVFLSMFTSLIQIKFICI